MKIILRNMHDRHIRFLHCSWFVGNSIAHSFRLFRDLVTKQRPLPVKAHKLCHSVHLFSRNTVRKHFHNMPLSIDDIFLEVPSNTLPLADLLLWIEEAGADKIRSRLGSA
ncbi:MAG: hypothetical protein V8R75_10185 [Oscillospiraceae bacterium]